MILGDYAHEYSRSLFVSEHNYSQKSSHSWKVDRQIFISPRYGEVETFKVDLPILF